MEERLADLGTLLVPLRKRETWLGILAYSLFIFSTLSITGIELSVWALYLLVIYHRIRQRPGQTLPAWIVAPFLLWVAVLVLSALANSDPLGNLSYLRHQYRIFLPFMLLPALAQVSLERLLKVYLVFAGAIALYGISQTILAVDVYRTSGEHPFSGLFPEPVVRQVYRARGNFAGPGSFANHMMMMGLLFVSLLFSSRGRARYWWGAGTVLTGMGLIASFGRSAWIGALVGLLVLALRLPRRWSVTVITVAVVLFGVAVALVESGWVARQTAHISDSAVIERMTTSRSTDATTQIRFYLWRAGLNSIKDRPLLGVGFGNHDEVLPYLKDVTPHFREWQARAGGNSNLHNIYLQVAFDLGLIGLAAYLAIWTAIFAWNTMWIRRAGNAYPLESGILWGACAALAGGVLDGIFHDSFFSGNANTTILMLMGISLCAGLRIREGLQDGKP